MTTQVMAPPTSFWRRFLPLWLLGMLGVVGLIPLLMGQLSVLFTANPALAEVPLPTLVALSLIQPAILVTLSVAIGVALAPRVGLRSYLIETVEGAGSIWPALRRDLPLTLGIGVMGVAAIIGLELLFAPFMPRLTEAATQTGVGTRDLAITVSGMLYGGIAEELMLRWGVMTLLVWLFWRVAQRGQGVPSSAIMGMAILLAAVLFGVGHLPAVSGIFGGLTPVLVGRTVLLNAIGGVLFGWLYWRRGIETAMLAHAAFHIILTLVSPLLSMLN